MARRLQDIRQIMKVSFMVNEDLAEMYSFDIGDDFDQHFSRVSIENILLEIVAFTSWTLENIFDLHKNEVNEYIASMKPHSLRWYRQKAMGFQYGYPLLADSDQYDSEGLSNEDIAASQIIKYCAVNEAINESRLIIKIATEMDDELAPISSEELVSFREYMQEVKDAGVAITITNYLPDLLKLSMLIYYDPLVFLPDGSRIQDGSRPVELAINNYLKSLPFNGILILASLVDTLQSVDGVKVPHIRSAESAWINPATSGYGSFMPIEVFKVPESGYFKITDFDLIEYKSYEGV